MSINLQICTAKVCKKHGLCGPKVSFCAVKMLFLHTYVIAVDILAVSTEEIMGSHFVLQGKSRVSANLYPKFTCSNGPASAPLCR